MAFMGQSFHRNAAVANTDSPNSAAMKPSSCGPGGNAGPRGQSEKRRKCMNLVSWTPFREMEGLFDRYNRLLGDRDVANFDGDILRTNLTWRPRADISETKNEYLIKAELPEVEKKDIKIEVENGVLTISGERRLEKEEETEKQHRIENFYGKFSRSFTLPSDIDEAKISANTKKGILKIHLPKTEVIEPKSIEVSVD
jgi:HSP20 family protein